MTGETMVMRRMMTGDVGKYEGDEGGERDDEGGCGEVMEGRMRTRRRCMS